MASKYKNKTTPKGTANYPWLTKPDTKYDSEGIYSVKLVCELNEETQDYIDFIEAEHKAHVEAVKNQIGKKPRVEPLKYEVNEDEGTVTFDIRMKRFAGAGKDRFEKRVAFFDASGKPVTDTEELIIRPGSIIKVSTRLFTWKKDSKAGLRLEPAAVQILRLADGKGGTAEFYGFEAEEEYMDEDEGYSPFEDDEGDDSYDGDDDEEF